MSETAARPRAGRIVVGVDASPSSAQALRWAVGMARFTGDEVHAVIGWAPPTTYGWGPIVEDIDWQENARSVLDHAVKDALGGKDALDGEDTVRVRQDAIRGHPAQVLVDAAADADLLVVGSRGHGGFAGMLLGSVSHHVIAHAQCPVLVVHEKDAPPTAAPA